MLFTRNFFLATSVACLWLVQSIGSASDNNVLTEAKTHKAELAAIQKAKELGRAGSFVMVDTHGEIIAAYRMPKALPSTFGFAKSKAETVVALGVSTEKLAKTVPEPILTNLMTNQGGKYVVFPGGYPVRINGRLVAGLAFGSTIVSLDSNVPNPNTPNKDADVQCAKAALAVLTATQ